MTIKQARKVLGKLTDNVSDEELEQEIKAAELLKVLYFNNVSRDNKSDYGKA